MPSGDEINVSKHLPTTSLGVFDQISNARARGEVVKVSGTRVQAREGYDPIDAINNSRLRQQLDSNYVNSIKDAARLLRTEVLQRSGPVTWKVIEKKVPELIKPTDKTEAKALIKAIKQAYGDKSVDAAAQIDLVLKQKNPVVDHPVKADCFEDYEEGLKLRGDCLAEEFAPGGVAWDLVHDLANLPARIPEEERAAAQYMLKADIRLYITEHGVLPSRAEALDMAIERARYISPDVVKDIPKFSSMQPKDFRDPNVKLGARDFPTERLRNFIEWTARYDIDTPWEETPGFKKLPPNYLNGDMQAAMYAAWSNEDLMYEEYGFALKESLAEIDKTPTTPENEKRQIAEKLKLFSPGTKFFEYLQAFNGDPQLNGESIAEYQRAIVLAYRENSSISDPVRLARDAYEGAQRVENARRQHRDPGLVERLGQPFPDEIKIQLKKEREINWVHEFSDKNKKAFTAFMTSPRLVNKPISSDGFSTDFEVDTHRANFSFDMGDGMHQVKYGDSDEVKRQLNKISGGHPVIKKTLSEIINQLGIAEPMQMLGMAEINPHMNDEASSSAIIKESGVLDRSNFEPCYAVRLVGKNKFHCEYDLLRSGDQLMINSSQIYPINRDPSLAGDATVKNYAERQRVIIELDRKDLEKGVIKPKFVVPPTVELHIKPDWGKIAVQAREEKTMDFYG